MNQIYACVSPETLVKTDKGIRPMKDIQVGELVFTTEGLEEVVNKVEYKDVPIYEIIFENGEKVQCSGIHRFINEETGEWISAEEIVVGNQLKTF